MKKYFSTLLFLYFAVSLLAQKRETLYDDILAIKGKKSTGVTFTFSAGEKLELNFVMVKGKRLRTVKIYDQRGHVLRVYRRPYRILKSVLPIESDGNYSIAFFNRNIFKRQIYANVTRIKPEVWRDSVFTDTLITYDTLHHITYDTATEDLLNEKVILEPKLKIDSKSRCEFTLGAPPFDNYYFAYWIGDEASNTKYNTISAMPSLGMKLNNLNDPLQAYGKGVLKELPITNLLTTNLRAGLCDETDKALFMQYRQTSLRNELCVKGDLGYIYGKAEMKDFAEVYPLHLCFENTNNVSPISFYVRVVGFKVTSRDNIVLQERVIMKQEIRKVKVE